MTLTEELAMKVRNVPDFPTPGIQFKDITPILADAALLKRTLNILAAPFAGQRVTKVIGIEARGFILGAMLAEYLGVGFVPMRKEGKLPAATIREPYQLEYGKAAIEVHRDALTPEDRVLVHDDVLATGGTASAACRLVRSMGAEVVACAFLLELDFLNGRNHLTDVPVHTILHF
jgi:adenine phosphoribosyltransferase